MDLYKGISVDCWRTEIVKKQDLIEKGIATWLFGFALTGLFIDSRNRLCVVSFIVNEMYYGEENFEKLRLANESNPIWFKCSMGKEPIEVSDVDEVDVEIPQGFIGLLADKLNEKGANLREEIIAHIVQIVNDVDFLYRYPLALLGHIVLNHEIDGIEKLSNDELAELHANSLKESRG